MAANHGFYYAYSYDNIQPGESMKVEHTVHFDSSNADISKLTALSVSELQAMREAGVEAEKSAFNKVCDAATEWEAKAADTLLLDKAIEYLNIPAAEHTGNQWQKNRYDDDEISNSVYKMYVRVYEQTQYNRDTKEHEPVAWQVSWSVGTNSPSGNGRNQFIGGQDRKRFTDKAAAEKYIAGRKAAYANLFTEISPPIPKNMTHNFIVNNQLLPGYTVQGEPPEKSAVPPVTDKKSSVMDKLAAAKDVAAKSRADKSDSPKKAHDAEL